MGNWSFISSINFIYIYTVLLGPEAVAAYGWRYPFFIAAVLVVIGLIMRLFVMETPIFRQFKTRGEVVTNPIVVSFRKAWKPMLYFLIIGGAQSFTYYTTSITTFATLWLTVSKIPLATTSLAFIVMYAISIISVVIAGYFMDIYGRRPFVRWGYLVIAITLIPFYSLFFITKDIFSLTIVTLIPLATSLITYLVLMMIIPELTPANVRNTAFNIAYQLVVGVFGGLTPYITVLLLTATGSIIWAVSYVVEPQQ